MEGRLVQPGQLFSHWEQVHRDTLGTLDKFSSHEISFVPFKGAWSVAQIALHIADAEDGWFRFVVQRAVPDWPPEHNAKDYPTTALIKALLTEVHVRTAAYLDILGVSDLARRIDLPWGGNTSLDWIIWHVLEHEIHHRGELSLILGLLGREGLDV